MVHAEALRRGERLSTKELEGRGRNTKDERAARVCHISYYVVEIADYH
jgi:hypothetical protein